MNNRIKAVRKHFGLTQEAFGKRVGISNTAISFIEIGTNTPSEQTIRLILAEFPVSETWLRDGVGEMLSDDTAERKMRLVEKYNKEGDPFKDWLLDQVIEMDDVRWGLLKSFMEKAPSIYKEPPTEQQGGAYVRLPLFDLPVAAGTGGVYIEDFISHEYVDVPTDEIPNGASYILTVRGDSMEPDYSDGDRVYVKAGAEIAVGEVGIFSINSHGFIKKLGADRLISVNPNHPDIEIGECDDFYPRGLVIGKYQPLTE